MKKCPECHSKRPMSLGNPPPNSKKMSLHRLPKALNKRFHQRMIHQKSKGVENRRRLNTNLWASGYRPSPKRGFRAQRRSPRAGRWRPTHAFSSPSLPSHLRFRFMLFCACERDHLDHLRQVMEILRREKLTMNLFKCIFVTESVIFFAFFVSIYRGF